MTDEPLESGIVFGKDERYVTLRIRLPRSTVAEMDREIAADLLYMASRNKFVYCAVKYALYCIPFGEGLE
jgi:hypothetical protein